MDENIAERYRRSLAACGKSTAAALDAAETGGISERALLRALKLQHVAGATNAVRDR